MAATSLCLPHGHGFQGSGPYHGAFRLLRQVNEEMQQVLRSSFDRGLKRCDIEIDDLDRHGIDVMAQIVKLEETSGAAGGVMFTSFGACGMKGCRWVLLDGTRTWSAFCAVRWWPCW